MNITTITKAELYNLKTDLEALLEKYNAIISLECSDCSDLQGVYDARIEVSIKSGFDAVVGISVEGFTLDSSDIN